jgi:hypothetical protein
MKKMLIFLITILILFNLPSTFSIEDDNTDDKNSKSNQDDDSLQKSLVKYRNMKIAGIVLTSIGGTSLVSGLIMGITYQTLYKDHPLDFPGTIEVYNYETSYVRAYLYLNPIILTLNLGGLVMLGIGIPVMIVGAVKEKKIKNKLNSFINNFNPVLGYNFNNSFIMGFNIRI